MTTKTTTNEQMFEVIGRLTALKFQEEFGVLGSCLETVDLSHAASVSQHLKSSLITFIRTQAGFQGHVIANNASAASEVSSTLVARSEPSTPCAPLQKTQKKIIETQISEEVYCKHYQKTKELLDNSEIKSLSDLKEFVINFEGCDIKKLATNTVFADGVPGNVMLIGEAPGENEDLEGIPFCGKSGQLLRNALKCIQLERTKNIYITNTLFWRPPSNRKPTSDEIDMCRPIVEKHISLVNPRLIILCGATAVESVLRKSTPMGKLMNTFFDYTNKYLEKNIPCTAIYHPAFLLRNPIAKQDVWKSLVLIKQFLDS